MVPVLFVKFEMSYLEVLQNGFGSALTLVKLNVRWYFWVFCVLTLIYSSAASLPLNSGDCDGVMRGSASCEVSVPAQATTCLEDSWSFEAELSRSQQKDGRLIRW
ncbi:hypothetical protein OIU78_020262 [Salix suchowensis]|nr:hypothetical protein OIU78_020262 [Salix suchowensis]